VNQRQECIKGKSQESRSRIGQFLNLYRTAGGTEIISIITKTSADTLNLKEGRDVYAVVKASNVMIAVD